MTLLKKYFLIFSTRISLVARATAIRSLWMLKLWMKVLRFFALFSKAVALSRTGLGSLSSKLSRLLDADITS